MYICDMENNMKFEIKNIIVAHNTERGFRYKIMGWVNGDLHTAYTNDSEVFDWYRDDAEPQLHKEAVQVCETKLMEAYIDANN